AGDGLQPGPEHTAQARLLRCIFGNPFHPVSLDPCWQHPDVVSFAKAIYDNRAFDRLPELAAALERAGCTDPDVLAHCREAGAVHVHGCWVLDFLTGRA